jgi:uncharacterized protein YjbJ (UPF0337 family)
VGFADKAKAKAQEMAQQAKEKFGQASGGADQHAEGQADQSKSGLQQAAEKAKDAFKN